MISRSSLMRTAGAIGSVATLAATKTAFAIDVPPGIGNGAGDASPTGAPGSLSGIFRTITNVMIYVIGAIAVIMLVIGGLQYVLSSGDAKRVENAKNTILYAIVGVVVAILAYAIIHFVFSSVGSGSATN